MSENILYEDDHLTITSDVIEFGDEEVVVCL